MRHFDFVNALTFSDVLIVPKKSDIKSRKYDLNMTTNFAGVNFTLPIISANMKTITGYKMAVEMIDNGGMAILHRFNAVHEALEDFKAVKSRINCINKVGVSIGVQEEDKIRFERLSDVGAKVFCIDVAHGHSVNTKNMLNWINANKNDDMVIIAGNIATGNAAYDLVDWGADIVKVGIGSGSQCTTRLMTGVGVPQLHALLDVEQEFKDQHIDKKIISDGGIKEVSDICKALKCADMVMLGGFISGTTETPGKVFKNKNGEFYKVYQGSASGENKVENGTEAEFIEGISSSVPFRGRVKHILREIEFGIRSCCSYVNAHNLSELKTNIDFIRLSNGSRVESKL